MISIELLVRRALLAFFLAAATPGFAASTSFTDTDNENNAGTGVADGDLDRTVGNTDPDHPIEFRINVPEVPT